VRHVGEPGVAHPPLELRAGARLALRLARRLEQLVDPDQRVLVLGEGAVFGVVLQVEVLELGPAARGEVPFL
jgi:hypothetical protein